MLDIQDSDVSAAVSNTQKLWTQFYGVPRSSGTEKREQRVDAGVAKMKESCQLPSLNGWLRERRRDVEAKTESRAPRALRVEAGEAWTQDHEKEKAFLLDKKIAHCAEEVQANRLECLESLSNEELQLVIDKLDKWNKSGADYIRRATRRSLKRALPAAPPLHQARLHVPDASMLSEALRDDLLRHHHVSLVRLQDRPLHPKL